jgi:hypothetical protein
VELLRIEILRYAAILGFSLIKIFADVATSAGKVAGGSSTKRTESSNRGSNSSDHE